MKAAKHINSFEDVIMNTDDIDDLRNLLRRLVPEAVQHQFVITVNKNVDKHNEEVLTHMQNLGRRN